MSNIVSFPRSPETSEFEIQKQQIRDIFAQVRVDEAQERRARLRAAGPQARLIDRATRRMAKAVSELDTAIDAIRAAHGLPSIR